MHGSTPLISAASFVALIGLLGGQESALNPPNAPKGESVDNIGETAHTSDLPRSGDVNEVSQPPGDSERRRRSAFANINGVKHHYLNWGGKGEPVLLLAGLGNTAHIFESFGSALANNYRVLALTRRGHGHSASPKSGYDTETRVEDIRAFLDSFQITEVVWRS